MIQISGTTAVIAASIGAGVGVSCALWKIISRKKEIKVLQEVTYKDLTDFADKCKGRFTDIIKSRVACEKLDNGLFRVTQLMLDNKLTAVRTEKGDVIGRIVTCKTLDDKVLVLCGNKFPSDFDFGV